MDDVDLLILSPHLDDAVFSLGGTIHRAVRRGQRVRVATFFTAGAPDGEVPRALRRFANHPARKREDAAALGRLGASWQWCELPERPFRPPRLANPLHVFRTPRVADPLQLDILPRAEEVLRRLLDEHPRAALLAPLAVGNHHDHVSLFVAAVRARALTGVAGRLGFYEDPYALFASLRGQHFVTRRHPWPAAGAPEGRSLLARGTGRLFAWSRRGVPVEALLPTAVAALPWTVERLALEPSDVQARHAAMADYASQVALLGGLPRLQAACERYLARWGGAEPVWRVG